MFLIIFVPTAEEKDGGLYTIAKAKWKIFFYLCYYFKIDFEDLLMKHCATQETKSNP